MEYLPQDADIAKEHSRLTLTEYKDIARSAGISPIAKSARQWWLKSGARRAFQSRLGTDPLKETSLKARLEKRIRATYEPEIRRRGGETTIEEEHSVVDLSLSDYEGGVYLLKAEGWRQYSSSFGARHASIAYLCGTDDAGRWAVRVPGTTETVEQALEYIVPGKVARAREAGKHVKRQGDVYLVETTPQHDESGELPGSHTWSAQKRKLYHDEPATQKRHRAVYFPWPVTFVPQRSLQMGRLGTGTRSGFAD